MFAQVNCPESLNLLELDHYLEKGWFRMGQTIFTTNFLRFKDQFYSAIWLRIPLSEFQVDHTQRKLAKQNKIFRTEIKRASIDPVKEKLFAVYKECVTFEASASLQTLMFGKASYNIYNTLEIDVYDGDKLIATGYFDVGASSAAGITCFYDPAYKKYSLGKYLIFQKIEYCKEMNLDFFYPGYFVPGYSYFNYKLEIGKRALQYFHLRTETWLPITEFSGTAAPLQIMIEKLNCLRDLLTIDGLNSSIFQYEFFDVNLHPDLQGAHLFDFPVFLFLASLANDTINPMIVYDVRDQEYHVIKCRSIWVSNAQHKENIYSSNLLKVEQKLYSGGTATEIVSIFSQKADR